MARVREEAAGSRDGLDGMPETRWANRAAPFPWNGRRVPGFPSGGGVGTGAGWKEVHPTGTLFLRPGKYRGRGGPAAVV